MLRSTYAHYIVELLDRFTGEEEESARAVRSVGGYALAPVRCRRTRRWLARYYELQLLALAGYQPRLFDCVRCGKRLREVESESPPYGFDCAQGGVLCDECAPHCPDALPLSLAALKVLRHAARVEWPAFAALKLRPLVAREVEQTMQRYITYILERNLKSVEFLRTLRLENVG